MLNLYRSESKHGVWWSASWIYYAFGTFGVPDPEPGFRSFGDGPTLEAAVRSLIDDMAQRARRTK